MITLLSQELKGYFGKRPTSRHAHLGVQDFYFLLFFFFSFFPIYFVCVCVCLFDFLVLIELIYSSGFCPREQLRARGYRLSRLACVRIVPGYQWHPTPVLLPGKSHGWRSLVGCRPPGREESDTTERLHFHFSLLCIGEGNGNSLQHSCLENPMDGGAR